MHELEEERKTKKTKDVTKWSLSYVARARYMRGRERS